eukprot:6216076-Ditylum_brightwellii.AAC.1
MKTNVFIQKVLLYKIQQWCGLETSLPNIPGDELGDLLTAVVSDQHELGLDNHMKGAISKYWGLVQNPDSVSTLNTQICKACSSLQHQMDNFDQQLFSKPLDD